MEVKDDEVLMHHELSCVHRAQEKCNYIFNLLPHKFVLCIIKRETN